MEFVKYFFDLLNSRFGGFIVCAFIGIVCQDIAYKGLALHKGTTQKEDMFYSELIGYLFVTITASFLYRYVNRDIEIFIYNISLAFGSYMFYAKRVVPWLKNKARGKS